MPEDPASVDDRSGIHVAAQYDEMRHADERKADAQFALCSLGIERLLDPVYWLEIDFRQTIAKARRDDA